MDRLTEEQREFVAAETVRLFEESLKESESLGEEVIMGKQQVTLNFLILVVFDH